MALQASYGHHLSITSLFPVISLHYYLLMHNIHFVTTRGPLRHTATDQRPEYLSFRLLPEPAIHRVSQVFSVVVQTQYLTSYTTCQDAYSPSPKLS